MTEHSRRSFMLGAGSSAVAGVAATVIAPTAGAAPRDRSSADGLPSDAGPLVAYVRDAASGEIALMAGDREVLFTDKALASRLVRKMG